jgi:hypothetical protein
VTGSPRKAEFSRHSIKEEIVSALLRRERGFDGGDHFG